MTQTSKRNIEAVYPLSPMQQGMLFHSLLAPESGVYFEQLSCTLRGTLDVAAFQRAWQRVIDRQPILRTAFAWKKLDKLLQVVYRQVELPFEQQDWRAIPTGEHAPRLEAFLAADRAQGFDLAQAPLIRLALLRTAEDAWYFIWSHHHTLLDGWSLPLLLKEVFSLYESYRQGWSLHLDPPRPYREYIAWLQNQDPAQDEAFWRHSLDGFHAPTPLVVDRRLESGLSKAPHTAEAVVHLSAEATASLQTAARQGGLTLSTLIQGAWAILLSRYNGEQEVVFGATVAGRSAPIPGIETMIGLFINTLPVRARLLPEVPVIEWLKTFQAGLAELRQFEYSSLVQIQEWSQVPRGLPLFESLIVFENYPVDASLRTQKGSLAIEDVRSSEQTNYPLTVVSAPAEALPLKISFDFSRFDAGAIDRMLAHMVTLLEGIAARPNTPLGALPLLSPAERQQVLVDWNATSATFPENLCTHEIFEATAARFPLVEALIFENERLSYDALNRQANRLARRLRNLGVGPETLVPICVETSLEMIVGALAVLKAGGAYVPLDPAYPADRIAFMLADIEAYARNQGSPGILLLTQRRLVGQLPVLVAPGESGAIRQVLFVDEPYPVDQEEVDSNLPNCVGPKNLAYVIYTSGSTGHPKGTLLEHRGLCNLVSAAQNLYALNPGTRVLQFFSFGFDGSVFEIFSSLLHGGTLVLARRETLTSVPDLHRLLEAQAVNVITMPPSMLRLVPADGLPALRVALSAGEACPAEVAAKWSAPGSGGPRLFLNGYGPTEVTVCGSIYIAPGPITHAPPIGRPIANTQFYILDSRGQPAPVGVPGELYIGGAGVARGYLNRPELTAERFIELGIRELGIRGEEAPDSQFLIPNSLRVYRTGDLVRWLADGQVEFIGRVDTQVKLRGFRIELGEIEAALGEQPGVRMAAVIAREEQAGEKYLAAYVVGEGLDFGALQAGLRLRLPGYMLPAAYEQVEALPLSPSGKVDRRALGQRGAPLSVGAGVEAYAAARTPVEAMLVELWEQVLGAGRGQGRVGIHDNFFELGGHSLLATQLNSRVREVFGMELPLRDVFEAPTVAGLAQRVEAGLRAEAGLQAPPIERVERGGELRLSYAQQRLWFLDQLAPGNVFYNIPTALRLSGRLDVGVLQRALNEIIRRHASLRTTFGEVGGRPVQVIGTVLELPVVVEDLSGLGEGEREQAVEREAQAEARRGFDLGRGPLVRLKLLRLGEAEHVALLTLHHIIADGWSMGVLVRELAGLYAAYQAGRPSPLEELEVQYADYAAWQRGWLEDEGEGGPRQVQLAYWKRQLAGASAVLELPTDRPRPAVQSSPGDTLAFDLPAGLVQQLQAISRRGGATMFMTLLAGFQALLHRYSGQEDINIGTPIANRNRAEIEGLIGFFVNTLVLRGRFPAGVTFRELLAQVRETALGAYAHQDLPFEKLVEILQPGRDLSHTPLFQVAFSLQNPAHQSVELAGLKFEPLETHSGTAKFDLTLVLTEAEDGLKGVFEYNTDLFECETIERMVGHFTTLLAGIAADPDAPVAGLPILTEAEHRQLLVEWNRTDREFSQQACAHELFAAWAVRQPQAPAVSFEGQVLSYAELDRRANQLGRYLQKLGVGPGVLVGLACERGLELVVGLLGVLKAGGAYLPLDPGYPAERLAFMVADAGLRLVLTQARLLGGEYLQGVEQVVCLDRDWEQIGQEGEAQVESGVRAEDLAYVIYTSGSTGRPKGVRLGHRGLVNLVGWQQAEFGIGPGSRVLQFSPLSFDASVWESFMALGNGGQLVLGRQEVLGNPPELKGLLAAERVSVVTLPPSVLRLLDAGGLEELGTVIAAGEACGAELVAKWGPGRAFYNAYGPTETTVCATAYRCEPQAVGNPPIGGPIANTQVYVLDGQGQPVPVGVGGELYVGGVGVAQGYLNRAELTAERFIELQIANYELQSAGSELPGADPQSAIRNLPRVYRTGDRVKWRGDGQLAYLGRIDTQVKMRGFRIELGEIEARLEEHGGVREAAVVVRGAGGSDPRLVAYVVRAAGQEAVSAGELRRWLKGSLPEYMLPGGYVFVDGLPLSPSGKVDRAALAQRREGEGERPEGVGAYVGPRNEVEAKLVEIGQGLLGIERVGVGDNFFELGGHSLLATQFISRVREAFEVELPLRAIFEHPDIAGLAELITVQLSDRSQIDEIAQMLAQVEGLSDDEVQALLGSREPWMDEGGANG